MISVISTRQLLINNCSVYLAHVIDSQISDVKLKDIPVVKEYLDVFHDNVSKLPPDRDVEFTIDLIQGTTLISMASYRMVPLEL